MPPPRCSNAYRVSTLPKETRRASHIRSVNALSPLPLTPARSPRPPAGAAKKKAAPLKGATFVVSTTQVAAGKKKPPKTPKDAAVCLYRLIANSKVSGVR
eukprot:7625403-Pyramimonas_sp.AAC.1